MKKLIVIATLAVISLVAILARPKLQKCVS